MDNKIKTITVEVVRVIKKEPKIFYFSLTFSKLDIEDIRYYDDNLWYYKNNKPEFKVFDLFRKPPQFDVGQERVTFNNPQITSKGKELFNIPENFPELLNTVIIVTIPNPSIKDS